MVSCAELLTFFPAGTLLPSSSPSVKRVPPSCALQVSPNPMFKKVSAPFVLASPPAKLFGERAAGGGCSSFVRLQLDPEEREADPLVIPFLLSSSCPSVTGDGKKAYFFLYEDRSIDR